MSYAINLIVMFFVELAMLVIFGYYGYQQGSTIWLQIIYATLFVTFVLVIWRIWAAPKSKRQLAMPYLVLFRSMLFLLAAFLLYGLGFVILSILFGVVAVITQIIALTIGKSHDTKSLETYFQNENK